MAWIESHQSLREHPKLYRLCELLHITKHEAIGLLHLLWWWACDYAPNGNITGFDAVQLAKATEWRGDTQALLDALLKARFLDNDNGVVSIHDWHNFRLHYDLMRQKRERQLSQVRRRVKRFRERQRNAPVTQSNAPNKPNQTNITKPTLRYSVTDIFQTFWMAYPRKIAKASALKAWQKLKPDSELVKTILKAIETQKTWPQWTKDEGQFIPHPATWLNQKRWEDEVASRSSSLGLTPEQQTAHHARLRQVEEEERKRKAEVARQTSEDRQKLQMEVKTLIQKIGK